MFGRKSQPKQSKLPVGSLVEAKIKGWKQFYPGKLTGFDSNSGTYSVEFEDGDKKDGIKSFNLRERPSASKAFTAPDGKKFQSKQAYAKYMMAEFLSFKDKTEGTHVKRRGDVNGQSFTITNLKNCHAYVMDFSDQVLVDGVENCQILIGPSSDSVFLRNVSNCTLFIACKQFRCRDCTSCTVSLYSMTEPVVESSSRIHFCPYNAAYPGQEEDFRKANLQPTLNHWANVFDFNKGDSTYPLPHWDILKDKTSWPQLVQGTSEDMPVNPVPSDALAEPTPKDTGFSFGLSQEQATQTFEAMELSEAGANPPKPAEILPSAAVTYLQCLMAYKNI